MYNLEIKNKEVIQKLKSLQKDNYSYNANGFIEWLESNNLDLNYDSISKYFIFLNESDFKAKTINIKRASVNKRVKQLFKKESFEVRYRIDYMLKEISEEVKNPKKNNDYILSRDIITKQEYKDLLNKCRSDRQKSFIMFLFMTGCRVNELTGIELKDCNNQGKYFIITVMGKFSKERSIRIDTELYNFIIQTFQGKKYLFETSNGKRYQNDYISKQIKKIGILIGRKISAHSLRHSFATNMINKYPNKIDSISKYMGHSSSKATFDHYIHTELLNNELFN